MIGTDYFTKWVEAEPLANIRDVDAKKFIWKNIVTQFGPLIPSSRITAFNLIARLSEDTIVTWELQTSIPLLPSPKEIDKLRLLIRS